MSANDEQIQDSASYETNIDVAKEDQLAAESEATGQIPKEEVAGLKDELGGGQILDGSEGYTRSSNQHVDALKQENAVDKAVDGLEE